MSRFNVILLVAAALQAATLLVITLVSDDGPGRREPRDLVDWSVADVSAIVIENPDADEPLRLEKRDGDWVVASADGFPARTTLIADDDENAEDRSGLLDKLVRIEVDRTVVRQAENHGVLRVADDDFERRLTVEGPGGKVLGRTLLSRAPDGRSTYVRRDGEDEVYETDEVTVWLVSADPAAWVTATFLDENEDDVVKLTARHGATAVDYVFERRPVPGEENAGSETETATEWWQTSPVERRADQKTVDGILGKCCQMSLTGILGKTEPDGGAYDAADVFTIELEGGAKHVLKVGAKRDDGDTHVKLESSEYWFVVSDWGVRGLRGFEPEKLVEKIEVEAPADGEDAEAPGEDG